MPKKKLRPESGHADDDAQALGPIESMPKSMKKRPVPRKSRPNRKQAHVDEETQARVTAHADEEAMALAKIGPIEKRPKVDEDTQARVRAHADEKAQGLAK